MRSFFRRGLPAPEGVFYKCKRMSFSNLLVASIVMALEINATCSGTIWQSTAVAPEIVERVAFYTSFP